MEYNESTCRNPHCRHRWQWIGYKTGLGKTAAQLEQMRTEGKTCPRCGSMAQVGLDMTSGPGQALSSFVSGLLVPAPAPEPQPSTNFGEPVLEVMHANLAPASSESGYRRKCIKCEGGILLVQCASDSLAIVAEDNCILCGQRYKYLDLGPQPKGPTA